MHFKSLELIRGKTRSRIRQLKLLSNNEQVLSVTEFSKIIF